MTRESHESERKIEDKPKEVKLDIGLTHIARGVDTRGVAHPAFSRVLGQRHCRLLVVTEDGRASSEIKTRGKSERSAC